MMFKLRHDVSFYVAAGICFLISLFSPVRIPYLTVGKYSLAYRSLACRLNCAVGK